MQAFSRSSRGVRTCIVVGGINMGEQRGDLRGGVEIVVATPGRFIDHLQQRNTSLNRVEFIVLDEADRMLDMGFEPQISGAGHQAASAWSHKALPGRFWQPLMCRSACWDVITVLQVLLLTVFWMFPDAQRSCSP